VKVMIALNTAWNLVNFRSNLIRSLVSQGYEVVAVAPTDEYAEHLSALGCRYVPLLMDNKGTNPARDLLLCVRFWLLLWRERPQVFLGYTVKPNIYGSFAAHIMGIAVVNNIAGLGAVFIKNNWVTSLVRGLYRLALSRSKKVFFQNQDDRHLFVSEGLVSSEKTDCLPGSGVDLIRFSPQLPFLNTSKELMTEHQSMTFLLVARMLWDKGVGEYVEAARILKRRHVNARFCLLGFLDVDNPASISRVQMDAWVAEGVIEYLGEAADIRPYLVDADCIVLPSYREGVPRSLLEAAAMARPIVTTNVPGCRNVVEHGVNGFLCEPQDASDLSDKLEQMRGLTPDARLEMGRQGRLKVEREFDERIVINAYLETIALLAMTGTFLQ
jgi:glycosyltransferase involved in cell wall biosynthesis